MLDLKATVPVVDVVTCTGAGGLNGTLLADALKWRVPNGLFEALGELWMTPADVRCLCFRWAPILAGGPSRRSSHVCAETIG